MRLGFVTVDGMGYEQPIKFAADTGFDFVELQMAYVAGGTGDLGRTYLSNRSDELNRLLEETQIDLLVHLPHTMDIGAESPIIRDAAIEETKENIRVASVLGAETCVIHPTSSARARAWTASDVRRFIMSSMRELLAFANERDVGLCLENLRTGVFTIDSFPTYFRETEGNMTLDTGHARITGLDESRIAAFIEENLDRIGHIHASDNKKYVSDFEGIVGDDHVPTGVGDLDFGRALSPIPSEWNGTVSLEIHTQTMEYLAVAKRTFERMIDGPMQ